MRILIADNAPRVRSALALYIKQCRSDTEIIEAANFNEVQSLSEQNEIDLALIDWHLPQQGGKATLQFLRRTQPNARVIVLSGRPNAMREAADADADAFISKGAPPDGSMQTIFEQRTDHDEIGRPGISGSTNIPPTGDLTRPQLTGILH